MPQRVKRHAVTQPLQESYRLIPLTQGQNAIVNLQDFVWLSQWNWFAQWNPYTKSFYAGRNKQGRNNGVILMHRVILDCAPNEDGDHRNHNTLDNRRENLRRATKQQNRAYKKKSKTNTSGFKGVSFHKGSGKWKAQVNVNGKRKHIGLFTSPIEAAKAHDTAAKESYGEFASLNFPIQSQESLDEPSHD